MRSLKHVSHGMKGNRRLTNKIVNTAFSLVEQGPNERPLVPDNSDATNRPALTTNYSVLA